MKIFLSHSSSDKDIVGQVFNQLGHGICHYDVATFDPIAFLPEQIYEALSESTHFVFFASAVALKSGWVNGELKTLFINWMRSKTTDVMVFLMRGGDRSMVPEWMQSYVITEHPSPTHIACRILSQYDKWIFGERRNPPFYRSDELKVLEKQMAVEAAKMPSCILISGTDGSGRKELLNQIFARLFRNVPNRKILIYSENFDSDIDLYKSLKAVFSLTTPRELSSTIDEYLSHPPEKRMQALSDLIIQVCSGSQAIIIDAADSIFSDSGEVNDWIQSLVKILPNGSYPLLSIVTNRRPSYINKNINSKVAFCNMEPLRSDDSSLLFRWWLNSLEITLTTPIYEAVIEQISGSPKLIETAAQLLKNIPDPNDMQVVKRRIFADLEQSASKLLSHGATGDLSKIILALIVDCGSISKTDLLSVVSKVMSLNIQDVTDCHNKLQSYGLVQADSICVKVPNYLARTAKSFGRDPQLLGTISQCWRTLGENMVDLQLDEETSISILNDACLVKLKLGVNSIVGIESLILPSQCLRAARKLYDNKEYVRSYDLCSRAFQGRLALTDDGAIEALRFCGMAAARLNDSKKLDETLDLFEEYISNNRASRISEFIRGFDYRLAGKFDLALKHMLQALKFKGDQDIHILRELAFLYLANNDSKNAKLYIEKAYEKARNNSFILELKILAELSFGKGYVIHNQHVIEGLIDTLESIPSPGSRGYAFRARVHYLIAKDAVSEARDEFEKQRGLNQTQSIVQKLLEAKLLLAEKKFKSAHDILLPTKRDLIESKGSQRRSLLPLLADLLIQAAAGIALSKAIAEFGQNEKYLTAAIREKTKKELIDMVAYSREKISPEERSVLGI